MSDKLSVIMVRACAYPHGRAAAAACRRAACRRGRLPPRPSGERATWAAPLAVGIGVRCPKSGSLTFENGGAGTWRPRSFSPARAHFAAPASGRVRSATALKELDLIILGVILLIIGFIAKIAIVWTLGIIVLVVGAILALLGTVGHAVGGRRHYF
jgi:hypothetical protein